MLRFTGSMRASPDKRPEKVDSEWKMVDDDHYEVRSLVPSASTGGNQVLSLYSGEMIRTAIPSAARTG